MLIPSSVPSPKAWPGWFIHVDAHADINEAMFGEPIAHGTPFRRAVEDGLLDNRRCVQIGLRGTGYAADDFDWPRQQGFRVVQAEDCWHKSLNPLMEEVREQMGSGPVYLTFDIDSLDPAFAPGTGTPETRPHHGAGAGIIRGCWGLNLVGCDRRSLAAYDPSGNTALTAANLCRNALCPARRSTQVLMKRFSAHSTIGCANLQPAFASPFIRSAAFAPWFTAPVVEDCA